jgi:hypothetical protein
VPKHARKGRAVFSRTEGTASRCSEHLPYATAEGEADDRIPDAIGEARARLAKIGELTAMPTGDAREKKARQLTSEFGMDLDDFYEFVLGEARK